MVPLKRAGKEPARLAIAVALKTVNQRELGALRFLRHTGFPNAKKVPWGIQGLSHQVGDDGDDGFVRCGACRQKMQPGRYQGTARGGFFVLVDDDRVRPSWLKTSSAAKRYDQACAQ